MCWRRTDLYKNGENKMEGIITLPYSEYDVINKMSKLLKKSDGYSFYIPTSRQQKGVDFVILKEKSNKHLRIQVKSSRSYVKGDNFFLWFNNFVDKYEEDNADLYVLYGLYPILKEGHKVSTKKKAWNSVILCFNEKEMHEFLKQVKTKKTNKNDKFFGVKFTNPDRITTERGFTQEQDISKHLLENYLKTIKEMF